jgi:hypothetical protein
MFTFCCCISCIFWPSAAGRTRHADSLCCTSCVFCCCCVQNQAPPSGLDLVRCIATARIVMPRTVVRLSAGRLDLSSAEQALAFMAGANSIFDGDKLLTTPNNDRCEVPESSCCYAARQLVHPVVALALFVGMHLRSRLLQQPLPYDRCRWTGAFLLGGS